MSVLEVTEEYTGISLEQSANLETGSFEGGYERKHCVIFNTSDLLWKRPILALSAVDPTTGVRVPLLWEALSGYPTIWVRRQSVEVGVNPFTWWVYSHYEHTADPLTLDPVIEPDFVPSSEPVSHDRHGAAIQMSSGETPDPPAMKNYYDYILRIRHNRASYDEMLAARYHGAVNSDVFRGHSAGKVKLNKWVGLPRRFGANWYYEHQFEFAIRTFASDPLDIGWRLRLLDQGYRKAPAAGSTTPGELITGSDGNPVNQPVLLDGHGAVLAEGADPVFLPVTTDPATNGKGFEIDDYLPFSVLGLA